METEKKLNIWGKGQLLAFSGLDGATDFHNGLVLSTSETFGLLLRQPVNSGTIQLGSTVPADLFLTSDLIESKTVKAVFPDACHLLLEGDGIRVSLPEEIAILREGSRILIGTKSRFRPELIRTDVAALIAERKQFFAALPE